MATTTTERFTGQVKFFNRDRGFGFITNLDDKKDYFVHYQDIRPKSQCWNILFQGEYVEFELRTGPNGEQAGNVTGVRGGTLMCENSFNPQSGNRNRKRGRDNQQSEPMIQHEAPSGGDQMEMT